MEMHGSDLWEKETNVEGIYRIAEITKANLDPLGTCSKGYFRFSCKYFCIAK